MTILLIAVSFVLAASASTDQPWFAGLTNVRITGQIHEYEAPGKYVEEPILEKILRLIGRPLNGFDDTGMEFLLSIPIDDLSRYSSVPLAKDRYPDGETSVLIFADKDYEAIRIQVSENTLASLRSNKHTTVDPDTGLIRSYNSPNLGYYVVNFRPRDREEISDDDLVARCIDLGNVEVFSGSCQYRFIFDGMAVDMRMPAVELLKYRQYRSAMQAILESWRVESDN